MDAKRLFSILLSAICAVSVYAQTTSLGLSKFVGAAADDRLNQYVRELRKYDIDIFVPDTLHSIDMRGRRNISQNISKDWTFGTPAFNDCQIGLETESANAVFLFPHLFYAWPKESLKVGYVVVSDIRANHNDWDLDFTRHIEKIVNDDKSKYSGADTIVIYQLDLDVPFLDNYKHLVGVYLRTYGHNALPIKIALTKAGLKNLDKYLDVLFDMVHVGSDPLPEYIEAEKETENIPDDI